MGKTNSSRSKWDILFDVLVFLVKEHNAPRTKVEQMIGLTSTHSAKHLHLLENRGFIRIDKKQKGAQTITQCNITKKGRELKEKLQAIYDLCGGEKPAW